MSNITTIVTDITTDIRDEKKNLDNISDKAVDKNDEIGQETDEDKKQQLKKDLDKLSDDAVDINDIIDNLNKVKQILDKIKTISISTLNPDQKQQATKALNDYTQINNNRLKELFKQLQDEVQKPNGSQELRNQYITTKHANTIQKICRDLKTTQFAGFTQLKSVVDSIAGNDCNTLPSTGGNSEPSFFDSLFKSFW